MEPEADYISINKALWDEKTRHHITSEFYDLAAFKGGKSSLNDIECTLLGDVGGKRLLHLQCHFGQDSLSLERMGAQVTGVDLSPEAIKTAAGLAEELQLNARFICSDVYTLPEVLDEHFDMVFASYGTIGWLPDMQHWANVVAHYLKPDGLFVFAEFHPAVWMFDDAFSYLQYSYFNRETIVENIKGTYADRDAPMQLPSVSWNHSLAEVMQSLIDAGLEILDFQEYDYSPYNAFMNMVATAPGKYQLKGKEGKLPLVYSIKARKK